MKNKNKKNKLSIIIGAIVISTILIIVLLLNLNTNSNALTLVEKRWIQNNNKKIIDISVVNDIEIFGLDGTGVFYDYLDFISSDTKLDFNIVAHNKSNTNYIKSLSLNLKGKKEIGESDFVFATEKYVLLSRENKYYDNVKDISNLTIGILNSEVENISYYLIGNNISYTLYENYDLLWESYNNGNLNYIIVPAYQSYKYVYNNSNYVNYNIEEYNNKFVLSLNSEDKTLNSILKKYFNKFMTTNYKEFYNNHYNQSYFKLNNIDSKAISSLKSKRYTVGYVDNRPYLYNQRKKEYGIVKNYLDDFNEMTDIDFTLVKYEDINKLITEVNENKVDMIFNNISASAFNNTTTSLSSNHHERFVIIKDKNNHQNISSIKSLKDNEVLVANNSILDEYIMNNVTIKQLNYSNIEESLKLINNNNFLVLDYEIYNIYKDNLLLNYDLAYIENAPLNYSFIVNNNNDNALFKEYFNKYISLTNYNEFSNVKIENKILPNFNLLSFIKAILIILLVLTVIYLLIVYSIKRHKEKKKERKEEKLKYIDMLTSLKNRNYLNNNISAWDNNIIYPQAVVMIDLNNVKYINDNYGSLEGDKIIKKTANILITRQLQNTEIIRTDGNEFMIYLIGYNETQVISYCRKLFKEFKKLPHGYGASIGHSMIEDDIKTIDDAINEASIIVRKNKETK